jgi:spermidine synthase
MTVLLLACVFVTGFAGLLYQITWHKALAILVGSHALATSSVLALFFLFLALGSLVMGRWFQEASPRRALLGYAAVEVTIGLYALGSESLFNLLLEGLAVTVGSNIKSLIFGGLFIFIPTFLMGGTVPLVVHGLAGLCGAKEFSAAKELSAANGLAPGAVHRHSQVYTLNTLGAFFGALISGFFLLEAFGVSGTLLIGGGLSLFAGITALIAARAAAPAPAAPTPAATPVTSAMPTTDSVPAKMPSALWPIHAVAFLSGFSTMALQTLLVRAYVLSVGGTAFAYAAVVAGFILPIAVGGALVTRLTGRRTTSHGIGQSIDQPLKPQSVLALQLSAAVAVTVLLASTSEWPQWFFRVRTLFQSTLWNFLPATLASSAVLIWFLFIPVALLGMSLPLYFSLLPQGPSKHPRVSNLVGRLYGVNALGSLVGAGGVGYWLFTVHEATDVLRWAAAGMFLACGILGVHFGLWRPAAWRRATLGGVLLFGVFCGVFGGLAAFSKLEWSAQMFSPGWYLRADLPPMVSSLTALASDRERKLPRLQYQLFDPNLLVTVTDAVRLDDPSGRTLSLNGKPESSTGVDAEARSLAALLPLAVKPSSIENVFMVGMGAGLSAHILSALPEVSAVRVAEISEGVLAAQKYFHEFNQSLLPTPNQDQQKIRPLLGDAYQILMSDQSTYDLVISEPTSPWVSGTEKLFSLEFYSMVRKRLKADGVMVQWLPLYLMDATSVRQILKTLRAEFSVVEGFAAKGGALTLIAYDSSNSSSILPTATALGEGKDLFTHRRRSLEPVFKRFSVPSLRSLLARRVLSRDQIDRLVTPQFLPPVETLTLFHSKLEYQTARAFFSSLDVELTSLLAAEFPWPSSHVDAPAFAMTAASLTSDEVASLLRLRSKHWRQLETLVLAKVEDPLPSVFSELEVERIRIQYLLGRGGAYSVGSSNKDLAESNTEAMVLTLKKMVVAGLKPKWQRWEAYLSSLPVADRIQAQNQFQAAWAGVLGPGGLDLGELQSQWRASAP